MLNKVMKVLTYLTGGFFLLDTGSLLLAMLVPSVAAVRGGVFFEYLGYASPLINTLFLLSIGWILTVSLFKNKAAEYDEETESLRRLGLSMIFVVPFIPLVFSPSLLYPYIVGKALVFRFIALGLFLTFIYLAMRNKAFWPRLTPVVMAYTAFTVAMLLSVVFSMDPSRSFWGNFERMEGYITVLSLFGLLVSLSAFRLRDFEWRKLFAVHVYVSLAIAAIAVVQYAFGYLANIFGWSNAAALPILNVCVSNPAVCRVDATFGNPIYLGIYAALSAWLIAYVAIKNKGNATMLWIAAILNVFAVYLSGTKSDLAGMFIAAVLAGFTYFYLKGMKRQLAILTISAVAFAGIFAGGVYVSKQAGICQAVPLVSKFCSIDTLFARFEVWKTALVTFKQDPIFGIGQENFIHSFNKNYNPNMYGQETYFDHPHNTYLGWLAMGGLLGFLTYIIFLLAAVWGVFKTYAKEENGELVFAIVLGAFVTYFIHIFFVFDNLTSILLFMFMAVYFGRNASFGSFVMPSVAEGSKKMFGYGLLAAFAILIFFTWWRPAYANMLTIGALSPKSSTPADAVNEISAKFQKVIKMGTFGTYEANELYLQKALQYKAVLPQIGTDNEPLKVAITSFVDNAVTNFKVQVADKPFDHRSRFMLGLYYTNTGDMALAETTLKEAVALAPNKQVALLALGRVYLLQGKKDEAVAQFKHALDVTSPTNAGYNDLKIQYIQSLMLVGNDKDALSIVQQMLPTITKADFQKLIYQMMQVFELRGDTKGKIGLLADAANLDVTNEYFYVWLAQSLVQAGNYKDAVDVIGRLNIKYPEFVANFNKELAAYLEAQKKIQKQTPVEETASAEDKATTTKKASKK